MTLKHLELHNYMIHRDFSADFDGNLVALTGEMGHGKSTFVGAIQFCLTGEHPPWHREDLLSWGTDEGCAKLEFVQDGVDCTILRKLHSAEVVLKIGEEPTVTGARNVEKVLATRFGVDKDILKQIGFVQQYEVQSILFDDPAKREKSFQKLLGIGDANRIWTELGTIIQSYSKSENFDASIATLKQMLERIGTELEAVDVQIGTAEKTMAVFPSRDQQAAELERMAKLQTNLNTLGRIRSQLSELERSNVEALERLSQHKVSLEQIKANMGGWSIADMKNMVETLRLKHMSAQAELQSLRKMADSANSVGNAETCPLCGNTVQPGEILKHVSADLERLQKAEADAANEYRSAASDLTILESKITSVENSIKSIEQKISTTSQSITLLKDQERTTLTEFGTLGLDPSADLNALASSINENIAKARAVINQYDDLNRQISALQGEKTAKKTQLDQASAALAAKEREKEMSEPLAKKVEVLKTVRDWFHASNGPRTMSSSAVRELTGLVNEYLAALHSEIEVAASDDGFSFVFRYVDGRPVSEPLPSTAKLSGGQKICLALAFRLAIYRCFGQQMGIMVLDEPTAHLSPAGVQYFGELLQTVSVLAKNMNLQIIMPTHEKEILPYMDSEIHFD